MSKMKKLAGCWWLTFVILATQVAEIRRIAIRCLPGKIVLKTLSRKKSNTKRAGMNKASFNIA
jgi:hypothetical protein